MNNDSTEKQNNSENETGDKKTDLYKPLALLAVFAIIVIISYSKNCSVKQPNSIAGKTPASQKTRELNYERKNPLGSEQTVNLKDKSEQFVISDDGRKVIAFSENSVVCYDIGASTSILLKDTTPELFRSGDFLPDGSFVMGGETGVGVWNTADGSKKFSMKAPGGVETVAASPDGQLVAGVSRNDGRIWLWETQKGNLFREGTGNLQSLRSSLFFESSSRLLIFEVSNNRSRILTLEIPSMKFIPSNWFDSTELNLKFAVNGIWLESGNTNRDITESELVVYEGLTGAEAGSIRLGPNGSGAMVDEHQLLAVSDEGIVSLIDLGASRKVQVLDLDGKAQLVATSKNGKAAVIKIDPKRIVVYPVPVN